MTDQGTRFERPSVFPMTASGASAAGTFFGSTEDVHFDLYGATEYEVKESHLAEVEIMIANIESEVSRLKTIEEKVGKIDDVELMVASLQGMIRTLLNRLNNQDLFEPREQEPKTDLRDFAKRWAEAGEHETSAESNEGHE